MPLQLRITRRAAAQIERAEQWWAANRPKAPEAFLDDLDAAMRLLAIQPGIGTRVTNAKLEGVRRLHLGRVRHFVFYRAKGDEIVILAVWHTSRDRTPVS